MEYLVIENIFMKNEDGKIFHVGALDENQNVMILSGPRSRTECENYVEVLQRAENETRRTAILFSLARN